MHDSAKRGKNSCELFKSVVILGDSLMGVLSIGVEGNFGIDKGQSAKFELFEALTDLLELSEEPFTVMSFAGDGVSGIALDLGFDAWAALFHDDCKKLCLVAMHCFGMFVVGVALAFPREVEAVGRSDGFLGFWVDGWFVGWNRDDGVDAWFLKEGG